ncbi:MAG: hypothetical protein ACD_28C00001G0007 [uncultured bacterium]|nr:MAG: hypothetical protein ACD_28C00001G0007 [uncultured bacterium]KKT73451.1 MAG: hypothetical protein UW70_C0083G0007 [Candidatus Peregrinibacteria bacterium GW2011_GWA2_44_7]
MSEAKVTTMESIPTNRPTREGVEAYRPKPLDPELELALNTTVSAVDEVVFSALKGVRRYEILRAPQEKVEEWMHGVNEFIHAIRTKDKEKVRALMTKGDRIAGDTDVVEWMLEEEALDESDTTLLAIGLFVLHEKSAWSASKSRLKVLKGGKVRMESAFEPEGYPNCYDIVAIVGELAGRYGIEGTIKGKGLSHAHFETAEGKISDPLYGWKRGGLFQTKQKFEAFKKEMGVLRRMGIKK